jgi:hypothetical protein
MFHARKRKKTQTLRAKEAGCSHLNLQTERTTEKQERLE